MFTWQTLSYMCFGFAGLCAVMAAIVGKLDMMRVHGIRKWLKRVNSNVAGLLGYVTMEDHVELRMSYENVCISLSTTHSRAMAAEHARKELLKRCRQLEERLDETKPDKTSLYKEWMHALVSELRAASGECLKRMDSSKDPFDRAYQQAKSEVHYGIARRIERFLDSKGVL